METSIGLGVAYHLIGALAAASFYIPITLIKNWNWEVSWLINGIASWVIMPVLVSALLLPDLITFYAAIPLVTMSKTFTYGALWGLGGLTFGMTLRFLGISVGYGVAIGITLVVGTLLPPLLDGQLLVLTGTTKGVMALAGVGVAVAGIALTSFAGHLKEKSAGTTSTELNVRKGLMIALFCGITSSFMAFAINAAEPIQQMALAQGVDPLYQVMPGYVVIMAGGFTTNLIYCLYQMWRNRTLNKLRQDPTHRLRNTMLSVLAGVVWYLQFFFYGWGHVQMTALQLGFVSWTFHMSMLVLCGGVWGFLLKEWQGCAGRPLRYQLTGMLVIVASTMIIGIS